MSLYGISDLHLALSVDKPMDVFGNGWKNYMERLKSNWESTVKPGDTVIVPGDISWATYLEQAFADFEFIDSLPGNKIISKGNHDYWWTTLNKLEKFVAKSNFTSISFMHNNSFQLGNWLLCGTRGWKCPSDENFSLEDNKIYKRELQRLELSLKSAAASDEGIIAALHYPPFGSKKEPSGFVEIMAAYKVKKCIYGHLHGEGFKNAFEGEYLGVEFKFISADYLKFEPYKLVE